MIEDHERETVVGNQSYGEVRPLFCPQSRTFPNILPIEASYSSLEVFECPPPPIKCHTSIELKVGLV